VEFFCTFEAKIKNMEIQELPDYKARFYEVRKYIDEPLLKYVWKVANAYKPNYDGVDYSDSIAPVIFANRYIESKLTDDEKYARFQEIYPNKNLDSAKQHYEGDSELDTSFKEKFFSSKEVLRTIKAFNLDINKFWYLLLFINDFVEDAYTNAPGHEISDLDKVNELSEKISKATEVAMTINGRESYRTDDDFTLSILKASIEYFIRRYNLMMDTSKDNETLKARLNKLGLNDSIKSWSVVKFEEKITLEKSHKTRLFADMFQYFLEDRVADRNLVEDFGWKDSTDKLLLISRLTHIVGLQGKEYYERNVTNKNGKSGINRRLSNLLSRYRNEPLPPITGRIYSGWG